MLLLDSRSAVIDDVSVFPDHADPLQWYYLPDAPHLTVVDGTPSFQLVGFRGTQDDHNGGLLSFDVNIGLDQDRIDALAQKIASTFDLDDTPRLAPVPPVDGSVRLLVLGTDSGAAPPDPDDPDAPAPAATPFAVTVLQSAKPSLYNDDQASFSVLLDQAAYAVVKGTLDAVLMPVAVVYDLDFLALRPAYQVTLTIDWDRVQKHLDETFGVKVLCFGSEISKVVDELTESKAIDLRADTFVEEGTDGVIDRRDAALAQVKAMITTAFFEPTLPPWTPEKPADWEKALRLISELATGQARDAALGPAGGLMDEISFTYKRTDYTRIDKKHLDVTFSERTTVRRSIHPQGHLASLFSAISASPDLKARLAIEVDVDDAFFDRRKVRAVYRPALAAGLIDSIDVRASYAGVPRNQLLVAAPWTADFEWLAEVEDGVVQRDVEVSYEVNFASVDASERPASLASAVETVTDDVVALKPEEDLFSIRSVAVLAERIPWTRFDSVEVHLRHRDEAHGIDEQQLYRLVEGKPDDVWSMLVVDRDKTAYEVRTIMRAVDGAANDVDSGWSDSDEEQVTVRNPFRSRSLAVLANVSWDEVRDVFVDVTYTDAGHDVLVQDTLHLAKGLDAPPFVVDLRDPSVTGVDYTVTFSYVDGRVVQLPPSTTFEPRLIVRPDMLGHKVVQVRPPADWAARGVERVTVELRFEDFLANLSYAASLDLDAPDATARFEFDYADAARNRYEWRRTVLYRNGLRDLPTTWTASADPVLTPRLA